MYFDQDKHTTYQKRIEFAVFVTALLPWLQSLFVNTRVHILLSSQYFAFL